MIVEFHPTADPAGSTSRFYDPKWGCFYVVKADLERAFGTSDFGEDDLEIVDPMGTARMRMHVALDRARFKPGLAQ